jgi:hypothetical protein
MKQLTLRQIPEEIERELRQTASRNETSLNQTAIVALQAGLGLTPPVRRRRDLSSFAGQWTTEEADEFDGLTQQFGQIDAELWQ